jgi:lantibiotic biosynthesis protein
MDNFPDKFLSASEIIGLKICRDAIWHSGRCNWIGPNVEQVHDQRKIYFRALTSEFYGGTSGIAFFLANLNSATPYPLLARTARGAMSHAWSGIDKIPHALRLGFYTGALGVAYSSILTGRLLDDQNMVERGLEEFHRFSQGDLIGCGVDVVDGLAGAIPAFIKIQRLYPDSTLTAFILCMGEHLIKASQRTDIGLSWKTIEPVSKHLTGFAHGTAGIATALMELFLFSGENRWLDAALGAITYENHYFDKTSSNWPDFRNFSQKQSDDELVYSVAWCHGAPGIALSRLRAFEITGREDLREDAVRALQTTSRQSMPEYLSNFSLCHGLSGNASILQYGSCILNDRQWFESAMSVAESGVNENIRENLPFQNGLNNDLESPDFMLGLAGIGYFFLQMFDNKRFPCPLIIS